VLRTESHKLRHSQPGVLTLLPALGPGTFSSQVAITLAPAPQLDARCSPAGAVIGVGIAERRCGRRMGCTFF
jgi:hypothetical protein